MSAANNVNEDEIVGKTTNNNFNVNDAKKKQYEQGRKVEVIADKLMEVFKRFGIQPKSRPFMCKVAWKLSEARIWSNLEQALKGANPIGLFIYLCKRDGV